MGFLGQILGVFPVALRDSKLYTVIQIFDSFGRVTANTVGVPGISNINAGITAASVVVSGNDQRCTVTYTASGTPAAGTKLFTINFANPYSASEVAAGLNVDLANMKATVGPASLAYSSVVNVDANNNVVSVDVYNTFALTAVAGYIVGCVVAA